MSEILIRKEGETWRKPSEVGYTNEAHLQALLQEHPELIPGLLESAKVSIEFQSGNGPSDVVAIDAFNGLTLVECKLASNPQVRREIIGQVLDYSSKFWNMPIEEFEAQWFVRTGRRLSDYEDGDAIRSKLEGSLATGEFRIILAVDEINSDLRQIVEYLNHITIPSVAVIAVVYSRSKDDGLEILSRQIYGEELAAAKTIRSRDLRERWTVEQFFSWVESNDQISSDKARNLLQVFEECGFVTFGGKALTPSLNVQLYMDDFGPRYPIAVYTQPKGTGIELRFGDFTAFPEIAEKFLDACEAAVGDLLNSMAIREARYSKYPKILLKDLTTVQIEELVANIASVLGSKIVG